MKNTTSTCDRAQYVHHIYYIFKACVRNDLLPSSHKIELFPKLRKNKLRLRKELNI